jgi:hypothetical protein
MARKGIENTPKAPNNLANLTWHKAPDKKP